MESLFAVYEAWSHFGIAVFSIGEAVAVIYAAKALFEHRWSDRCQTCIHRIPQEFDDRPTNRTRLRVDDVVNDLWI